MSADDAGVEPKGLARYEEELHVHSLLARTRAGEAEAFGELCLLLAPRLRAAIAGKVRNEDIDDHLQNTFLRAWQRRAKINTEGFLFTILQSVQIDGFRKDAVRARFAAEFPIDPATEDDVEKRIDDAREHKCLAEAFVALPKEDRVILESKKQGMSFDLMAVRFNRPETTIRRIFNRIRDSVSAFVADCLARAR
jgi:RNA polymerase sigma factor (sigma-70 family)